MTIPILFDDAPRARRTDPLTSHAAADGTARKREHAWLLIERSLAAQSPMTAQEIIHFIRLRLGVWVSESRITTGMSELLKQGAVKVVGTRENPSGYHAQAYELTDEQDKP